MVLGRIAYVGIQASVLTPIKRYIDVRRSAWVYSMWPGYLERNLSLKKMQMYFNEQGCAFHYLHTSGHARLSDLKRFVEALQPKTLIPIHTYHPNLFQDFFSNVQTVENGERIEIQ